MFPDASRVARTRWADIGLSHLYAADKKSIKPEHLMRCLRGEAEAVQVLAEEIATLKRATQPLIHPSSLTLETEQPPGSEAASLTATNFADYNDGYAAIFNGRVKFNPPLNGNGVAGNLGWARADADWVNFPGNGSYVDCTVSTSRTEFYPVGDPIRVFLPRAGGRDPNVRWGNLIAFCIDANGEATAVSGYLDDPVGTVKPIEFDTYIPGGWVFYAQGVTLAGYSRGSALFDPAGGFGGSIEHTHASHPASQIDSHEAGVTSEDNGGSWSLVLTFSNVTPIGTMGPSEDEEIVIVSGTTITTSDNFPQDEPHFLADGFVDSELVHVRDPGHGHGLLRPFPSITRAFWPLNTPPFESVPQINTVDISFTDITFNGSELVPATPNQDTFFTVSWFRPDIFEGVKLHWEHRHTLNLLHLLDGNLVNGELFLNDHSHTIDWDEHSHPNWPDSGVLGLHDHGVPAIGHTGSLLHNNASNLPPFKVGHYMLRIN